MRPRNDKRGVDLISDALPFGRLWYKALALSSFVVRAIYRKRFALCFLK